MNSKFYQLWAEQSGPNLFIQKKKKKMFEIVGII
jgi:hypothetical protein